jgi:pyridoxamine 5'-phosphate oxidase
MHAHPYVQFQAWMEEFRATGAEDATAFALSTVASNGDPDARTVLLKEFREGDLIFYTNYASKKGKDLEANPRAHALFFWPSLERQIRVLGSVHKISAEESSAYFASRPLGSQWGAAASQQSQPIASREAMEAQWKSIQDQHPESIPRPEHWGGYAIRAERIEFWQGRASRLHDRIQFTRQPDQSWTAQRLQP